ncbi:Crp/Fnr family transcriptional regulator [Paracoccus sp. (in: a-proteobacteria)]|uniref:Crp/Fnr family transcriptional regulator n=1 Tax=Paracoccus sp. TaxID=267 RepID=UPI0028B0B030|nr:Crp/Fnr family transcriptional regulator [Paracoccus sp. (in: a-proteobacteria)]
MTSQDGKNQDGHDEVMVRLNEARSVLTGNGWLSKQPGAFQDALIAGSIMQHYNAGDVVFRAGDPLGGIYGLVSGAMCVTLAPPNLSPRLVHVGTAGSWIGEGCFLAREPRRVGVHAPVETWMMHVPLRHLDRLARDDPQTFRYIALILMSNLDTLVLAYCEHHHPDEKLRIAAALLRQPAGEGEPIPMTQTDLGILARASRKMVNAALGEFAEKGWVRKGYREVTITDRTKLSEYVALTEDRTLMRDG